MKIVDNFELDLRNFVEELAEWLLQWTSDGAVLRLQYAVCSKVCGMVQKFRYSYRKKETHGRFWGMKILIFNSKQNHF